MGLGMEWGPAGLVRSQFRQEFGFAFDVSTNSGSAWANDIRTIISNFYVVTNNGPTSIGGDGCQIIGTIFAT